MYTLGLVKTVMNVSHECHSSSSKLFFGAKKSLLCHICAVIFCTFDCDKKLLDSKSKAISKGLWSSISDGVSNNIVAKWCDSIVLIICIAIDSYYVAKTSNESLLAMSIIPNCLAKCDVFNDAHMEIMEYFDQLITANKILSIS